MNTTDLLTRITAANDQDKAACDEWIKDATIDDIARVWFLIQKDYMPNAEMEIMSRFAQLALGEAIIRRNQK